MLHKLSLEREPSAKADVGQITTILECDESCADSLDSVQSDTSDRAQLVPDSTDEAATAGSDPLPEESGSRKLPKVRVQRATADAAAQVAIADHRQNSLPDLGSRRAPRHRSMSRKDSGRMTRKGSGLPPSVASQVYSIWLLHARAAMLACVGLLGLPAGVEGQAYSMWLPHETAAVL